MSDNSALITPIEKDALQEIMNIAFGQAAADLSDVINHSITLTVPYIELLHFKEISPLINREIAGSMNMSMIKQFFSGRFSGTSVLIFPHGEGKKLLQMFDENAGIINDSGYDSDMLEKETLIEISNIIMGACISKIAQLLGDVVSYSPPHYYPQDHIYKTLEAAFKDRSSFAIFLKTRFYFQQFDATGFLFLICDPVALDWLKKAIEEYLNKYV
jgi:chemotaxis protein CheC